MKITNETAREQLIARIEELEAIIDNLIAQDELAREILQDLIVNTELEDIQPKLKEIIEVLE